MRTVTALMTALTLLGFAGAASAMCSDMDKPAVDETAQTPIVFPEDKAGS
jgi:hypothetical protein